MFLSSVPLFVYAEKDTQPAEQTGGCEQEEVGGNEDTATTTIIETGDVIAKTDVVSEANTSDTGASVSDVTTTMEDGSDMQVDDSATTTDDLQTDTPPQQASSSPLAEQIFEVISSSTVDVEIDVFVDTDSGDNTASENEGSIIVTGDAYAQANVVTMANTNIVNSDGFVMLLGDLADSLDLRDLGYWEYLDDDNTETDECDNFICGTSYMFIETDSTADVINNVVVEANSGENEASENSGDGLILTGDAHASANVLNLTNTNIVNSNYMVFSANHFGSLFGDFLFPAMEDLEEFFSGYSNYSSPALINTDNTAYVENNVFTDANTGDNTTGGSDESIIVTGVAQANTNVINQINQNYVNSNQFSFVFKVHGSWNGSILGLPDELVWSQSENGGSISYGLGGDDSGPDSYTPDTYYVNATNSASVVNNVSVSANTGDNMAENNDFSGVGTGDAYAGANVINIVNSNILGRNWLLAVVNIFGDWTGNVSFGQTDLWIGGQVDTHGKEYPDSDDLVTYNYTVINNSDTIAHGVHVVDRLDHLITFSTSTDGVYTRGGFVEWFVGDLGPGESVELDYTAIISYSIGLHYSDLENVATVSGDISDANYDDNTDIVRLTVYGDPGFFTSAGSYFGTPLDVDKFEYKEEEDENTGSAGYTLTEDPVLSLIKTNNASGTIAASTTVSYEINIKNDGGEAYYALLFDVIKDEDDNIIYEQYWPLETIYPEEEIIIQYDVFYNSSTKLGTYTNYAHIEAIGRYNSLDSDLALKIETEPVFSVVVINSNDGTMYESVNTEGVIIPVGGDTIERNGSDNSILINNIDGGESDRLGPREHLMRTFGNISLFNNGVGLFGSNSLRNTLGESGDNIPESSGSHGLGASVLDAFSNLWISRYSWIFLLMILGLVFTVLVYIRGYAQE